MFAYESSEKAAATVSEEEGKNKEVYCVNVCITLFKRWLMMLVLIFIPRKKKNSFH